MPTSSLAWQHDRKLHCINLIITRLMLKTRPPTLNATGGGYYAPPVALDGGSLVQQWT